jgi:hypothetical protein
MATRNIVPRADGEGNIGTSTKSWLSAFFQTINILGAAILTEITTPSTPSSGTDKLYFKSDHKLYKKDSTGTETEVGIAVLTNKGDLYGFSTVAAKIPVGNNNEVLTADSNQTLGVKWAPAAAITRGTFVNGDLSTGVLTITHNKALSVPYSAVVVIFDNTYKQVIPDEVTGATNTVAVDLSSYGTLTGTWGYAYIA